MAQPSRPLKTTPLNAIHRRLGAKMIDFGGWDMPVQYASLLEEHHAVRRRAGLFDVSHMGEIEIRGPDALRLVNYVATNDASRLHIGQAQYSSLLYEHGGFVDDILIHKIRVGRMLLNEPDNDDGSVAVRTSGCYNITIDDVEAEEVAVGVALHAGDAGFEYSREPDRHIGHAGYVIKNILLHKVKRRGIMIDGISDNIYRAILRHGHHAARVYDAAEFV